jgi:hypothetical protein
MSNRHGASHWTTLLSIVTIQYYVFSLDLLSTTEASESNTPVHWLLDIEQQKDRLQNKGVPSDNPLNATTSETSEAPPHLKEKDTSDMKKTDSPKVCILLIIGCVTLGILSLVLSLWWTTSHNDISGGFTLGSYVLSISAVLMALLGVFHKRKCHCWDETSRT